MQKVYSTRFPRRSPIQVLTGLDVAELRWSDENRCFQRDMAVDNKTSIFNIYKDYSIQFRKFFFLSFFWYKQFFFLICSRPQLIIYDIGYIIHPSIKYFHNMLSFLKVSDA